MILNEIIHKKEGEKKMKHKYSKIGEYGIRWKPIEGYKKKSGKKVPPHMKKMEFKWRNN
jgi:hypothetical protein